MNSDNLEHFKRLMFTVPTRVCFLCDIKEYENAKLINYGTFWLCDECKEALKRLVEHEKVCIRRERVMEQLEKGEI